MLKKVKAERCNVCNQMGVRLNYRIDRGTPENFTVFICEHYTSDNQRNQLGVKLSGKNWTEKDYDILLDNFEQGVSVRKISEILGRTEKGVYRKIERLRSKRRYFQQKFRQVKLNE